ncbi:MAG: glyoxalase [Lachnospiraceae bacterium]|nr:glyoxalase [Candidatus Merdinaster equi]
MDVFDNAVLDAFLEKQGQLYEEKVAETREEALEFLDMVMAVVVDNADEVWEYFDEEGVDMDGADRKEILNADEVFEVGDGRYLIVEG